MVYTKNQISKFKDKSNMPGTQTDPRVETAKEWRPDVYKQNKATAHGGKD